MQEESIFTTLEVLLDNAGCVLTCQDGAFSPCCDQIPKKKQLKKGDLTEGGDTYDPTPEVEEGGSAICAHPQLRSEFIFSLDFVRICLKRTRRGG